MLRPELIQTVWARTVVGALTAGGVDHLIICPGSRSTPLVAAALELGVPCRSVLDERSAAFLAVGSAKVSESPVALVCTSGTAPAHFLPAVIEAAQSATPLVVVSADRPPELHGCQAPQTVDQQRLFGIHCRWFADLGVPEATPEALRGLVRAVRQAVAMSRFPHPGPVHINVPLRKPLAPTTPDSAAENELAAAARSMFDAGTRHWPPEAPAPSAEAVAAVADACRRAKRGVIVLGPAPLAAVNHRRAVAELAAATGFPVLAEGTSQQRFHVEAAGEADAFELLAGSDGFEAHLLPDLVLQLGAPATGGAWGRVMDRHPEVERWLVAASGWPDPHASANAVVAADVGLLASRLAERLRSRRSEIDPDWNEAWTAASQTAWDIVDEVLGDAGSADNAVAEGAAVRAVAAAAPGDAIIAVGNGLPVRSLDWYLPAVTGSWQVWCQRGASGIDGLIAGAAGASLAASRPVVAVLGDVAFAHDASSLAVAKDVQHPLVLVVLDNRGGRLFELLPEASVLPDNDFERLWLTPPAVDPTAVARAYGVPAVSASTAAETTRAVAEAAGRPGATVVRVAVEPSSHARHLAEIRRRLAARWKT